MIFSQPFRLLLGSAVLLPVACTGRGGFEPLGDVVEIVMTERADFEAPGSSRVRVDTSRVPGAIVLDMTPSSAMTPGPPTTATTAGGAHSLELADGRFLIIHGDGTNTTSLYHPGDGGRVSPLRGSERVGDPDRLPVRSLPAIALIYWSFASSCAHRL